MLCMLSNTCINVLFREIIILGKVYYWGATKGNSVVFYICGKTAHFAQYFKIKLLGVKKSSMEVEALLPRILALRAYLSHGPCMNCFVLLALCPSRLITPEVRRFKLPNFSKCLIMWYSL